MITQINLLRGIACLLVIIDHMFFTTKYFNIGAFGVGIFFLVSGFVIPISLKSSDTPLKFLIRRGFRLYPAAIVCLSFVCLFSAFVKPIFIRYEGVDLPQITIFYFIATVLQIWDVAQAPTYVPIFWTLVIEEKFYYLMALCFSFNKKLNPEKLIHYACFILTFFLLTSFFISNFYYTLILRNVMFISYMLLGSLFYFKYNEEISLKKFKNLLCYLSLLIIICIIIPDNKFIVIIENISFNIKKTSIILSYGSAFVFFYVLHKKSSLLFKLPKRVIEGIAFIALISFPLYSIHTEIWHNIANRKLPLLWFIAFCIISFVIHKVIERPFMKLGKKLTSN